MGNLPICMHGLYMLQLFLTLFTSIMCSCATVWSPTILIKEWVMQEVTDGEMLLQMKEKHVYIKTDISVS